MSHVICAYVPVLHAGYVKFFRVYGKGGTLYVFGTELIREFDHLRKEIRALEPEEAAAAVRSLGLLDEVRVADTETLAELNKQRTSVTMPREDVSRKVAEALLSRCTVHLSDVFLRWDKDRSLKTHPVIYDRAIPFSGLTRRLFGEAYREGKQSSDWWRQVGAIAVRNGTIIATAHNYHLPSPHAPYAFGDPRNNFTQGAHIEVSTAMHAEAAVVATTAGRCEWLAGADH